MHRRRVSQNAGGKNKSNHTIHICKKGAYQFFTTFCAPKLKIVKEDGKPTHETIAIARVMIAVEMTS